MSEIYKSYRVAAVIDLGALENNIGIIRQRAGKSKITAVVKADAYGHGARRVATHIEPYADAFAVAIPEEGIELRDAGISKPILILGETMEAFYPDLFEYSLTPCVFNLCTAEKLNGLAKRKAKILGVQVAVDTGMSRLGFYWKSATENIAKIASLKNLKIEGVYSHLACSDEKLNPYNDLQRERFEKVIRALKRRRIRVPAFHLANSAEIIERGGSYNFVRAGIMLYGLYPSGEVMKIPMLKPVMSLVSHIASLNTLPAGTGVSYGKTYVTNKKTVIATIPVGYADGYPRALSNKGRVIIKGQSALITGRVCMDQFMADVTHIKGCEIGDEVILIGGEGKERITADEIAAICGTINYEIVTGISKRVPRVYIKRG